MKGELIGNLIGISLFLLYFIGLGFIIADDHRYTSKDVMIGVIVFPYPWYVGGKELLRYVTASSEEREFEGKCLDASEALGMLRKARLRYCECLVETNNREACAARILTE